MHDLVQIVNARRGHKLPRFRINIIGSLKILFVPLRDFNDLMHSVRKLIAFNAEFLFPKVD